MSGPASNKAVTFRVRQIPSNLTTENLSRFLDNLVEAGLGGADNIHIRSLAPSSDDWTVPPKQVATIDFTVIPPPFNDTSRTSWIYGPVEPKDQLLFDTDFLGFTPLNHVEKNRHDYDCVAVSGLASHPFGSWRSPTVSQSSQYMWLRDQLPLDFTNMRVMLYGYDTALFGSQSYQTIDDLARTLIIHLRTVGRAEISARPLVLVAHSLGGVIVKRALQYLASSRDVEDFMLSKISLTIFFGVPNEGMLIKHLRAMVKNQPNETLIQRLSIGDSYLRDIDNVLEGTSTFRKMRLVSVYETCASPVAEQQPDGSWKRAGTPELLVSRESAIAKASRDPQDVFHIDQDHSGLVKFPPGDVNYITVRKIIADTLSRKPDNILPSQSWNSNQLPNKANGQSRKSSENLPTGNSLGYTQRVGAEYCASGQEFIQDLESSIGGFDAGQQFRDSLVFSQMNSRAETISQPEKGTFDWIFDTDHSFMEWFRTSQRMYWIRGKPGSGKSTMMKHLQSSPRFTEALRTTDLIGRQTDLWFFFNDRGSYLQKTLDGLLRTLLHQLVSKNDFFYTLVFKVYCSRPKHTRNNWDRDLLRDAFNAIIQQKEIDITLLLFLDALDEYNGFPEDVSTWILHLIKASETGKGRTKFRICFSSRPWDAFVRAFDKEPGMVLHKHTMDDIKDYARGRLARLMLEIPEGSLASICRASVNNTDLLIDAIAQRAEGVFLWVKFAVDELTTVPHGTSIEGLMPVIERLPDELQSFYEKTVARIPIGDRFRAFVLLELVLRSFEQVKVEDLVHASSCARGSTFTECQQLLEQSYLRIRTDEHANTRLLNLCGGLLEQKRTDKGPENEGASPHLFCVQFIHQTVRDFVGKPGFAQIILGSEQATSMVNGYTFWMKYYISDKRSSLRVNTAQAYARSDEMTNGRSAYVFLDSIPNTRFPPRASPRLLKQSSNCFSPVAFALLSDLRLYIRRILTSGQSTAEKAELRNIHALHLLALDAFGRHHLRSFRSWVLEDLNLVDMATLLVNANFSCHEVFDGLTAFEVLLTDTSRNSYVNVSGRRSGSSSEMVRMAHTFIKIGGQNPNVRLCRRSMNRHEETLVWTVSDDMQEIPSALHGWPPLPLPMLDMLLGAGAYPNILDNEGRTALDALISKAPKRGDLDYFSFFRREMCDTIMILLDHEAKISERSQRLIPNVWRGLDDDDLVQELRTRFSKLQPLSTGSLSSSKGLEYSSDQSDSEDSEAGGGMALSPSE